jgi:hypothetical protein
MRGITAACEKFVSQIVFFKVRDSDGTLEAMGVFDRTILTSSC